MVDNYEKLINHLDKNKVCLNEPLSKHTTFRLGGTADLFFHAGGVFDLLRAVVICREWNVPFIVLGGGSNVIVGDKGFRGIVILNRKGIIEQIDDERIEITSGTLNTSVVQYILKHELSGLEFIAGIPGTIGGAIRHNARFRNPISFQEKVTKFDVVKNQFVADFLEDALIITPDNNIRRVSKDYINPQYHKTNLKEKKDIMLSGRFKLERSKKETIRTSINKQLLWRKNRKVDIAQNNIEVQADPITGHRAKQPALPSPGCVFSNISNPDNHPVGRILDMCGLKGMRIGDIMMANEHANYIVNLGNGKASDALDLIRLCQERVKQRFNLDLELEIELVGEF
ncbi:UDP-N-acetylmuramate dehydrogenase [bacterium]|nr:UDP-N-acetylmuramate dehydrogenase [bacterium]MBU1614294.1 UDP-N-acetylmuramate dehydrogenase [bacterium]